MKPDYTTSKQRKFNPVDQLSELPVHLLHCILSFLDRKKACKTRILSKTWGLVSATSPVLHFSYGDFVLGYTRGTSWIEHMSKLRSCRERMMEYVDTTMQRYSREGLRITKFTLELPVNEISLCCNGVELACKVDEWLKIAADNQVVELKLEGPPKYKLPGILFAAKSLKRLDCSYVVLPYYEAMDLASLENLHLDNVFIEDAILNHIIISSCLLLKTLELSSCRGFNNMVIPASSKLETLDLEFLNPMKLIVETSSLTRLKYFHRGLDDRTRLKYGLDDECWPVISKASLLGNLRILEIYHSSITDKVVDELLIELTLLETLKFCNCYDMTTIKVSSTRLKEINLDRCDNLLDIEIDAPSLRKFRYFGYFKPSLSFAFKSQANCDVSLLLIPSRGDIGNSEFLVLKKLLTGISSCNVLTIVISNFQYQDGPLGFQFDEEELGNIHPGPPCYVRELKLKLNLLPWRYSESSITAFLDGLFWNCHPDVICLHGDLGPSKETIESMIRELKRMTESRSHPLKRVEAEGANCSKLPDGGNFVEQLRLHW